jgi:hypothetical protein
MKAMSKGFRLMIRRGFVRFVRDFDPGFEVLRVGERRLLAGVVGKDPVAYDLVPLYGEVAALQSSTDAARQNLYWAHLRRLHEAVGTGQPLLSVERHGGRIRPQIVTPTILAGLSGGAEAPQTPLGTTGLVVVYVLDGPRNFMLLTSDHARELGLDVPALHALAVENLGKGFPADAVRAVEKNEGSVLKLGDPYNAARVLVVAEHLREGEAVAAGIPDRDTLILAPVPSDGNWDWMREGCGTVAGPRFRLSDQPLRVSRAGIEAF